MNTKRKVYLQSRNISKYLEKTNNITDGDDITLCSESSQLHFGPMLYASSPKRANDNRIGKTKSSNGILFCTAQNRIPLYDFVLPILLSFALFGDDAYSIGPQCIWDDSEKRAVHGKGGIIYCQLWQLGRADPGQKIQMSKLSAEDVQHYVPHFKHAAENAMKAEFDGVEVHAAH
ncbi:hypothetical protein HDV02_005663, partial [Globomyces sp. JEL0801]